MIARTPIMGTTTRRDGGFSLIEVLVTLTILAGLMVAFTPLAGRMLRSWAAGAERANRTDQVATAIDRLRRDVAGAVAFVDGADPPKIRFEGSPGGFSLVTQAADGPEQVTIETAGGRDRPSLLRTARAVGDDGTMLGRGTRVALLQRPITARFAYRTRAGALRSTWEPGGELPAAVEVSFLDGSAVLFGGPVPLATYASAPVLCLVMPEPPAAVCPTSGQDQAGEANAENRPNAEGQGSNNNPPESRNGDDAFGGNP